MKLHLKSMSNPTVFSKLHSLSYVKGDLENFGSIYFLEPPPFEWYNFHINNVSQFACYWRQSTMGEKKHKKRWVQGEFQKENESFCSRSLLDQNGGVRRSKSSRKLWGENCGGYKKKVTMNMVEVFRNDKKKHFWDFLLMWGKNTSM